MKDATLSQSPASTPGGGGRIATLDALRGLAALAVCWFHLTRPTEHFASAGPLELSGRYGYLGVEVFFVISGFIIPYTLWRSGYRLADYRVFVAKRVIRLDPPYIACMALIIALAYLSALAPGYRGAPPSFSVPQLLSHLGYVNLFFGYPWINLVFWTLAIEFQYYLFIGGVFPLIVHPSRVPRYASWLALGAAPFLFPQGELLFSWLAVFLLGILTCGYRTGLLHRRGYLAALPLCAAAVFLSHGGAAAGACLATALAIAFVSVRNPLLSFLGEISYSVYLLHVPVGGRVVNLAGRVLTSEAGEWLAAFLAACATVLAAWLFYLLVERPAQRWSSRLAFGSGRREKVAAAACATEPT